MIDRFLESTRDRFRDISTGILMATTSIIGQSQERMYQVCSQIRLSPQNMIRTILVFTHLLCIFIALKNGPIIYFKMSELMDIVLTIPESTAECGRGFNVMKQVKSD